MKLAPQSRDILRQYKALINARRRDAGLRELTTAQVMDEFIFSSPCGAAWPPRSLISPARRKWRCIPGEG